MTKDRLFSTDYFFILISNFLFFFAFYLILPIFALFLMEDFGVDSSTAGAIM